MRDHAKYLEVAYGSSERRTCQVLAFGRSMCRFKSVAVEQAAMRMRLLTIVDKFTRESLAIKVAASIGGQSVVEVLHQLMKEHYTPETIQVDNGP